MVACANISASSTERERDDVFSPEISALSLNDIRINEGYADRRRGAAMIEWDLGLN